MKSIGYLLGALLVPGVLFAEDDIPLLRPEERQAVDCQADEFNAAVLPPSRMRRSPRSGSGPAPVGLPTEPSSAMARKF